jgi:hypothetical protein
MTYPIGNKRDRLSYVSKRIFRTSYRVECLDRLNLPSATKFIV